MWFSGRVGLMMLGVLLASGRGEVRAGLILGNLPPTYSSPTYNTDGEVSTGRGGNYSVAFSANSDETVTSATLVLTIKAGVIPTLGIYDFDSTNLAIGSLVGSFTDTGLTVGTAQTETFTGSADLKAGGLYVLVLDGSDFLNWVTSFGPSEAGGLVPLGPGATYLGAGYNGFDFAGGTKPSFELDGPTTAPPMVPEPSSLILSSLGGVSILAFLRSRKRRAGSAA